MIRPMELKDIKPFQSASERQMFKSRPDDRPHARHTNVMVVDHTTLPGGAELALPRLAAETKLAVAFLFLEPAGASLTFSHETAVVTPTRVLSIFGQLLFLRRTLRENPTTAIASNTLRAGVMVALMKMRKQSHVVMLHDGVNSESLSHLKRLVGRLLLFPSSVAIVPNSDWSASTIPHRHRIKLTPIAYSFSGTAGGEHMRRSPAIEGGALRLLFLGRLVNWKGVHVILDALSLLADSRLAANRLTLTIAGSPVLGPDNYVSQLQSQAASLPFTVDFVGHIEDIDALLLEHDVLVHSSIRPEPFGQVVVQGLSYGLAVVATDGGGPAELIDDGKNGFLYEPGNALHLSLLLRRLVDDRQLAGQLARGGVQRAAHFTDSAVAVRWDAIMTDVLGTCASGRKRFPKAKR